MHNNIKALVIGLLMAAMSAVIAPNTVLAIDISKVLSEIENTLNRLDASLHQIFTGSTPANAPIPQSSTWDVVFGDFESKWEMQVGAEGHEALKKDPGFVKNSKMLTRLGNVAKKLVPVCERKELTYHFAILDSDELNAFALPGGYVYVTRKMMETVQSDDELAAVIAHELGHINKKHSVHQAEKSGLMNAVLSLISSSDESKKYQQAAALAAYFANLKFSRNDEFEADRCAVEYLVKAGYDPNALVTFLNRINTDEGKSGKLSKYFSTHPPTSERIEAVQTQISSLSKKSSKSRSTAATSSSNTSNTKVQSTATTSKQSQAGSTATTSSSSNKTNTSALQQAYDRYIAAKQAYEQSVSRQASMDEIMQNFEKYQAAKIEYTKLRNAASTTH